MRWEWLELMTGGTFRNKFGWAEIHPGCNVEGKDLFFHMYSMSQYHSVPHIAPIKRERSQIRPTPEVSTLELSHASLLASSRTFNVRYHYLRCFQELKPDRWQIYENGAACFLWQPLSKLIESLSCRKIWIFFTASSERLIPTLTTVSTCRPADINIFLNLIYIYFLPLNAADTVRHSRTSDCLYANIKLWIIATSNGLLQERMLN